MRLLNLDRRHWVYANVEASPPPDSSTMNLYCWPCRAPHVLLLRDVERIVYALGAHETDKDPRAGSWAGSCLLQVLRWADDAEIYAEHVEEGIECREHAPSGPDLSRPAPDRLVVVGCDGTCGEPKCRNGMPLLDLGERDQ